MSYFSSMGGSAGFGGFGYASLGADYPIMHRSDTTVELQQQLVRLRFLQPDSSRFGADGVWGPQTAGALMQAARYVGWTGDVFTPTNADQLRSGTVQVSEDLLTRLRAAHPAPVGTPGSVSSSGASPENGGSVEPNTIGPRLDTATQASHKTKSKWGVPILIGGGLLLAGAVVFMSKSKKSKPHARSVSANRRRRRSLR